MGFLFTLLRASFDAPKFSILSKVQVHLYFLLLLVPVCHGEESTAKFKATKMGDGKVKGAILMRVLHGWGSGGPRQGEGKDCLKFEQELRVGRGE